MLPTAGKRKWLIKGEIQGCLSEMGVKHVMHARRAVSHGHQEVLGERLNDFTDGQELYQRRRMGIG